MPIVGIFALPFGILLLFALLGFAVLVAVILAIARSGRSQDGVEEAETRDLQELHRVLERMEQRVDRLEEELYRRLKMEKEL